MLFETSNERPTGDRETVQDLLSHESMLLDNADLKSWLALFCEDCHYWIPGRSGARDPRMEVNIVFDDRRRLEDRVMRLSETEAHSQSPSTSTVRVLGLVEIGSAGRLWDEDWLFPGRSEIAMSGRVSANVGVFRHEESSNLFMTSTYYFAVAEDGLRIAAKKVELLGLAGSQENLSFIL